ncbi:MAG TPA: RluA family pseudouridine synthase [Stellaceae bacterium]|nr:RluA family pseudouridine synthase [Stellaceae bacterium]
MSTEPPGASGGGELRHVTVQAIEAGERLDRLLAARLGDLSRTRLKRLVESGRVSLNGATVTDPSLRVKPAQLVAVRLPPPSHDTPQAQPLGLDIRYEDAHVIVIDKPAGLVVHPAPGNPDHTLVNALLAHCGATLAGIGGVRRPGIVHRLDKDTSGLIVVAKTELAHARLAADFAARRITRAYQAAVRGVPAQAQGEIAGAIGRSPANRKKMAVVARRGKAALTRYHVLRRFGTAASLVECRLATGRTHQIRVHLASIGHPVLGDPTYGGGTGWLRGLPAPVAEAVRGFRRQALHANVIGFTHPATGEPIRLESPLPADIRRLIDFLESL